MLPNPQSPRVLTFLMLAIATIFNLTIGWRLFRSSPDALPKLIGVLLGIFGTITGGLLLPILTA